MVQGGGRSPPRGGGAADVPGGRHDAQLLLCPVLVQAAVQRAAEGPGSGRGTKTLLHNLFLLKEVAK